MISKCFGHVSQDGKTNHVMMEGCRGDYVVDVERWQVAELVQVFLDILWSHRRRKGSKIEYKIIVIEHYQRQKYPTKQDT